MTIFANFVEVWLAKDGHAGDIGINLLTKVQMPNLASLYGAMLAGVDIVIMGAGIPREIPAVLDAYADHQPARLRFEIENLGRRRQRPISRLRPPIRAVATRPLVVRVFSPSSLRHPRRDTRCARRLAASMDSSSKARQRAGTTPRRADRCVSNDRGEPLYGERDVVDLADMRSLGVPFWLAGGTGSPNSLADALNAGAAGIQVGTLFAYADESGIDL